MWKTLDGQASWSQSPASWQASGFGHRCLLLKVGVVNRGLNSLWFVMGDILWSHQGLFLTPKD